jgi:hypothetical protein
VSLSIDRQYLSLVAAALIFVAFVFAAAAQRYMARPLAIVRRSTASGVPGDVQAAAD